MLLTAIAECKRKPNRPTLPCRRNPTTDRSGLRSRLSVFRDRDGHKTKRALTGLRSRRARALIERQPERRPEGEDGERRHQ